MLFASIVQHYFLWHYTKAFSEFFHVWLNFIWFNIHFFSLAELFKTWFAPWKRTVADRGDKWNFEDLAGYVLVGLLSRLIGFVIRTAIIVTGLISLTLTICGGAIIYLTWIALPILSVALFVFGITFLIA